MPKSFRPAPPRRDDLTLLMTVSSRQSQHAAVLEELNEGISQGHFPIGCKQLAFLVHRVEFVHGKQNFVIKIRAFSNRPPQGWTVAG